MGSRGSRSWENNGAQPLNRSLRPPPAAQPGFAPPSGYPAYGGGSFFQRHPFLTGLAGGALGSWLFGHSAGARGLGGGAGSALGTLLWIVIIVAIAWFLLRLWRRGAISPGWRGRGGGFPIRPAQTVGMAAARGRDVNLADADLQAFQRLHAAVQDAWSTGDLTTLSRLMTPEMAGYFSEELTRNASQGVRNIVRDVRLLKGELSESWEERDLQYATAYLRWSAIDYVVRIGAAPGTAQEIVGGDPRAPVETEEVWTFVRRRGGGWLLSAIQQV